jgi:hypothetical protein
MKTAAEQLALRAFKKATSERHTFEGVLELYVEAVFELHQAREEEDSPPAWRHTEDRLRRENLSLVEQLHEARAELAREKAHTPWGQTVWEKDLK